MNWNKSARPTSAPAISLSNNSKILRSLSQPAQAMSLPPELLNRVNRDLSAKVQAAAADLARAKSLAQMNRDVLREAMAQLTTAKAQYSALQGVLDANKEALRQEEEKLTVTRRQSEKAASSVSELQNRIADLMTKVTSVDTQLGTRRVTLKEAEDERAQMEEAMLAWLADNAVAGEATAMADGEMKASQALCKRLQEQADGLQVKIRLTENAVWEGSIGLDHVRAEASAMRQQQEELTAEVARVRTQLAQLAERAAAVDEQQAFLKDQAVAAEEKIAAEKARRDELRREADAANNAVQQTLLSRGQRDATRGRSSKTLADAQALLREEERRCEELEIQLRVAAEEARRMGHQLADMTQHRDTIAERCGRYEAKLVDLRTQYAAAMAAHAEGSEEAVDVDAIRAQREKELAELEAALSRGRHMLQQRRREMILTAHGTEEATDRYGQMQRHLAEAKTRHHSLAAALQNLTAAADTIDEEAGAIAAQISVEKTRFSEANAELRREYHSRIAALREELAAHEKLNLRARKSVEAAQSAARLAAKGLDAENDLAASLEEDKAAAAREINALITELEGLAIEKERAGSHAEGLHWQLEGMRQQAEALKGELVGQHQEQEQTALAMRAHELSTKATIDGLRVTLHAHQEEKSKMAIRLNAIAQRSALMQSRYEDMMATLERRVYGPEGADGKGVAAGGTLAITNGDGPPSSSFPSSDAAAAARTEVTPEGMQAHLLIGRAAEREGLQQRGDGLDSAIVAAEKDLRQLTTAVAKLQEAYSSGRSLVREGHSADAVVFGLLGGASSSSSASGHQSAPLLLLTDAPSREEEALVAFARARVAESDAEALRAQLLEWDEKLREASAHLGDCRAQEERVGRTYAAVTSRLGELRAQCAAKERQFAEIGREVDREALQCEKSRSVAFQKQAALLKKRQGTQALAQVVGEDNIAEAVRRLLRAASSHSPQCYYAFRTLSDTYGLPVDVPSAFGASPEALTATALAPSLGATPQGLARASALSGSAGGSARGRAKSVGADRISQLNPNLAPPRSATKALVQQYVAKQQAHREHLASFADPLHLKGSRLGGSSTTTTTATRSASNFSRPTASSARAQSVSRK